MCRLSYILVKEPVWPKGLLRTELTHASGRKLPDGMVLPNHMVETERTLPDASPNCSSVISCLEALVSSICGPVFATLTSPFAKPDL